MSKIALILQHDRIGPCGSFGDWADERGYELQILHAHEPWETPDLSSIDLVASLGSESASYDDSLPWLRRELEVLRTAHDTGTPVFGICFGSQSLARALDARTYAAPAEEIGWIRPNTNGDDAARVLQGPWLFWHYDRFDVPAGAQLLAETRAGPAAFRIGNSMGVQFHPEVSPELITTWLAETPHELPDHVRHDLAVGGVSDPVAIRVRAWALYDFFASEGLA